MGLHTLHLASSSTEKKKGMGRKPCIGARYMFLEPWISYLQPPVLSKTPLATSGLRSSFYDLLTRRNRTPSQCESDNSGLNLCVTGAAQRQLQITTTNADVASLTWSLMSVDPLEGSKHDCNDCDAQVCFEVGGSKRMFITRLASRCFAHAWLNPFRLCK